MNRPSAGTRWSVLVGTSLLAMILFSAHLGAFASDTVPTPKSPTAQEEKSKTGDAGKVQERSVKRPAPRHRPPTTPPLSPPSTPPGVPIPYPN